MEGSIAKMNSAADDHAVTPDELRKTRSKNPLKWFRSECKCSSSRSSSAPPKAGAESSKNETKEKRSQPAAPIQRSSAPLVVNYFPSGMPLSRRWSGGSPAESASLMLSTNFRRKENYHRLAAPSERKCKVCETMSPVRSVPWQSCFSWTSHENSCEMSPCFATAETCSDDGVTNRQQRTTKDGWIVVWWMVVGQVTGKQISHWVAVR